MIKASTNSWGFFMV